MNVSKSGTVSLWCAAPISYHILCHISRVDIRVMLSEVPDYKMRNTPKFSVRFCTFPSCFGYFSLQKKPLKFQTQKYDLWYFKSHPKRSRGLPSKFQYVHHLPIQIIFWRLSFERWCTHYCLLLGIEIVRNMGCDTWKKIFLRFMIFWWWDLQYINTQ